MTNPFAQFAPRFGPPPAEEVVPAPAPAPEPPPAPVVNDFAEFAPPSDQPPAMETWTTELRGKKITFQAPRGASKAQVRAAAKAAGVPDPQNRSLQFGDTSDKPTLAQQEQKYSPVEAAVHQGVDFVFPFVDEIAAGINSVATGNSYTDNMRELEFLSENTDREHPFWSNAGRVGATLGAIPMAVGSRLLQGGNWINTSLRTAAAGAPLAGVHAYASNPVDDRLNGVPLATALGAGIGLALPGATNLLASVGRRADQRLGISDWARRTFGRATPEESSTRAAVDVMAARVPQNPVEMRARVQEFRDTGHEPTLVNAMDESGRGFVGAMARRPGPGRETAQRAYDARRLSAPERIDRNMATVIEETTTGAPAGTAVAAELRRPVDDVLRDLTENRSQEIEAAMAPIRNNVVPLTPRMAEIIDTADGRRAIARAMRTVSDDATLAVMRGLPALARQIRQIDPRMPPATRQQIIDQLLQGQGLTVDVADRLARKFNAMSENADSDVQRVLRGFARDFRDEARSASPEYGAALDAYSTASRSIDAIETGGEFLATNQADDFARRVAVVEGVPPAPGVPSDRQRAMQGARRAVQRAAGENISNAPGVARRIAVSPEQHVRNTALFGELNAERLERAMAITERDLRDFAQVAPNTGSATALRGQDDEAAAGMLQAVASIKTGNFAQGALALLRSIGIRDQDAGRIVEMATDPAQVDQLIDLLERSYGRQTAAALSRVLALPTITTVARTTGGSRQ
jgi:hypothetical protein